jgi:hypothetical protein
MMQLKSGTDIELVKNGNKIFDYSQELVMLNYLFESKLISKDEMLIIKRDIEKSYGLSETMIS